MGVDEAWGEDFAGRIYLAPAAPGRPDKRDPSIIDLHIGGETRRPRAIDDSGLADNKGSRHAAHSTEPGRIHHGYTGKTEPKAKVVALPVATLRICCEATFAFGLLPLPSTSNFSPPMQLFLYAQSPRE